MQDLETNDALWQELLSRVHVAERQRDVLHDQIVKDHDEHHEGPIKWCTHEACRTAAHRFGW
jgi:hypothetical protein